MAIEVFNRYEHKYILDRETFEKVIKILDEHIDKIWTRFYRVDDVRNDEYGSSGLGLSMVKSIIELHGGEITVKSSPGHGTEFRIML